MSAAAKWKIKEKEATVPVAAKTDAFGFKEALKTGVPGTGGTAGAADILGRGGSQFAPRTPEKSTALGKQQPIAANSAAGGHSKLPSSDKDSFKMPQTKEVKGSQVSYYPGASFVGPSGVSKTSVGDKESASNSGGRRSSGVGSRTEEELTKPKEADVRVSVSQAKDEASKDADAATAFAAGRTKGLAGFWANQADSVKPVKKKRLTAVDDALAPTIVENSPPEPLEGATRWSEDPGEWKKPIRTKEGWTRNAVGSRQTQGNAVAGNRATINLIGNSDTDIKTAARVTKGSSQLRPQNEPLQRPREEKKKAAFDRSQDTIVLAENQPAEADPDVVRSESAAEEVVLERGRTRNLLQHWKNTEVEYNATKTSTSRFEGTKPAWILEIETAKGNIGGNNDDDDEDYDDDEEGDEVTEWQTKEKTKVIRTIATKNSERDKTKKGHGEDADKAVASVVESRAVDKRSPLKRERIAASGETKPAPVYFKEQEKQPMSVRNLKKPDCRRIEPGDNKLGRFGADDQTNAEINDVRSVGEGAPSTIPSFDQNARNKRPASSFENASRKEWKIETRTGNETQRLPGEKPATEEFCAWHGTAGLLSTAPDVKRTTDYETDGKTSAEDTTSSFKNSTISSTTQSEVGGDRFGYIDDSSTLESRSNAAGAELKQTDLVIEVESLGQGNPKAAERGSHVESFASSVHPPRNSGGALDISTAIYEDAHPEPSAAFSKFNPLTTGSPFVSSSSSGYDEKTEPGSSPTVRIYSPPPPPSFRLVEGVDSTPCLGLLPTWSVAVENIVENLENCSECARADSRQNEAPVYGKAVESSVDKESDYSRADKIEATKKSAPSQRSCRVM